MSRSPVRHCWSLADLSAQEAAQLLGGARTLKQAAGAARPMRGCHVAVLSEAGDGASAALFAEAAEGLGAAVARIGPFAARLTDPAEARGTARTLGQLYRAVLCEGFSRATLMQLERWAGVPMFDAVAGELHPTRLLGDVLTIESAGRPLAQSTLCVEGEADDPLALAWQRIGPLVGLQVHPCEPARCTAAHCGAFLCTAHPGAAWLWEIDDAGGRRRSLREQQKENHRFVVQALLAGTVAQT
jgi:ornithine carbamoyltransferase